MIGDTTQGKEATELTHGNITTWKNRGAVAAVNPN